MNILQKFLALMEEGTYPILGSLMAICLVLWVMVAERSHVLFGPAWQLLWPPARRRLRERREALLHAVDEFIAEPSRRHRQQILARARAAESPYGRFLLRVLGGADPLAPSVRDLELAAANLKCTHEIEHNLGIISVLAKAAPLVGLLGTVTGMIQTFSAMMVATSNDPRALSSGVSMALIATEVGLVVALPGVMGMAWLNRQAQRLEEEINLVSMRLRQVTPEAPEEVFA